jgi:hypothetical protein
MAAAVAPFRFPLAEAAKRAVRIGALEARAARRNAPPLEDTAAAG